MKKLITSIGHVLQLWRCFNISIIALGLKGGLSKATTALDRAVALARVQGCLKLKNLYLKIKLKIHTKTILPAMKSLCALILGASCMDALANSVIYAIDVQTSPALAGKEIKVVIKGYYNGISRCGLSVNFGDGDIRLIQVNWADGLFPQTLSKVYKNPGVYTISAEGEMLFRGLDSSLPCASKKIKEVNVLPVREFSRIDENSLGLSAAAQKAKIRKEEEAEADAKKAEQAWSEVEAAERAKAEKKAQLKVKKTARAAKPPATKAKAKKKTAKAREIAHAVKQAKPKVKANEEVCSTKLAKLEAKIKAMEEAEAKKVNAKAEAKAKSAEQARLKAEAKAKTEEQAKGAKETKQKTKPEAETVEEKQ